MLNAFHTLNLYNLSYIEQREIHNIISEWDTSFLMHAAENFKRKGLFDLFVHLEQYFNNNEIIEMLQLRDRSNLTTFDFSLLNEDAESLLFMINLYKKYDLVEEAKTNLASGRRRSFFSREFVHNENKEKDKSKYFWNFMRELYNNTILKTDLQILIKAQKTAFVIRTARKKLAPEQF